MRTVRKLNWLVILILLGLANVAKAQTTLYLDGGTTHPHYSTLYDAIQRVTGKHSTYGDVTILVRANSTETKAITLQAGDNITIVNRSGARHSINWSERPSHRMFAIVQNCVVNIGAASNGNNAALILRCAPSSVSGDVEGGDKALFKVVRGGILNIYNNTEIAYGDMPIWLTTSSSTTGRPAVNMYGGVIHSAKFACVYVQQGDFNMYGGYICGHYNTGGLTIPNTSNNRILDFNYVDNYFKQLYGVSEPVLEEQAVTNFLKSYYGKSEVGELNNAWGVYLHKGSTARAATFNFYGGAICGLAAVGQRRIPVDYDGADFTYYTIDGTEVHRNGGSVLGNRATINLLGGSVYANRGGSDGAGVKITNDDFDMNAQNVPYNEGYINMSAGRIVYNECQSNGGGVRVEKGTLFTMTGGTISHNVTYNPNGGSGGGGGIRMVSAKFVMSGTADISYNHSTG